MLNRGPQQPHQLHELLLRFRLLSNQLFEPFELIETKQDALLTRPLFERVEPLPRRVQRVPGQLRQWAAVLLASLLQRPPGQRREQVERRLQRIVLQVEEDT